jgi:hypothetical protein
LELIDPILGRIFGYQEESLDNRFVSLVEFDSISRRNEFTLKRVDERKKVLELITKRVT